MVKTKRSLFKLGMSLLIVGIGGMGFSIGIPMKLIGVISLTISAGIIALGLYFISR